MKFSFAAVAPFRSSFEGCLNTSLQCYTQKWFMEMAAVGVPLFTPETQMMSSYHLHSCTGRAQWQHLRRAAGPHKQIFIRQQNICEHDITPKTGSSSVSLLLLLSASCLCNGVCNSREEEYFLLNMHRQTERNKEPFWKLSATESVGECIWIFPMDFPLLSALS